jgi:hypothetical protein
MPKIYSGGRPSILHGVFHLKNIDLASIIKTSRQKLIQRSDNLGLDCTHPYTLDILQYINSMTARCNVFKTMFISELKDHIDQKLHLSHKIQIHTL